MAFERLESCQRPKEGSLGRGEVGERTDASAPAAAVDGEAPLLEILNFARDGSQVSLEGREEG